MTATAPGDSVLHLLLVADVLHRRARERIDSSADDGWAAAAHASLNRCVGALEHEVANTHVTLRRLADQIVALRGEGALAVSPRAS